MKTRTYTKHLIVDTAPTKKSLMDALVAYKPKGIKDFFVTCLLHGTATEAAERGWLDRPGTYEITTVWFSKEVRFDKVINRVRKIS